LGGIPAHGDVLLKASTDAAFPNAKVFERFGSKASLIRKLAEYCRTREGFEDIVLLCEGHVSRVTLAKDGPASADGDIGFVYLMKSGKYYKIGRSNASGRREYERGIQLP
jgi:hypothetical protein